MAIPRSPFVKADSLYGSLNVLAIIPTDTLTQLDTVTGASTGDLFTKTAHGLLDGDVIAFSALTGGSSLAVDTLYWVIVASSSTFQLAASYADAIAGTPAVALGSDVTDATLTSAYVIEADSINDNVEQSRFNFTRRDSRGIRRNVRTVFNQQQEAFVFNFDQAKRLPGMMGGGLVGFRDVKVTLWKSDPLDAAGKSALKSETNFLATMLTEQAVNVGGGEGTIPALRIESNKEGVILFTRDATA